LPNFLFQGLEKKGSGKDNLAHATLQQHLTVVRLFHDFLVEERICGETLCARL